MSGEANGPALFGPNGGMARPPKTDTQGRVLKHNATVQDVYEIVAAETAKVHEFYLNQLPPFVARMIQDSLMSYGLIQLDPAVADQLKATAEAPVVPENAGGDTAAPDSNAPEAAVVYERVPAVEGFIDAISEPSV